jgi:hypothetical protein
LKVEKLEDWRVVIFSVQMITMINIHLMKSISTAVFFFAGLCSCTHRSSDHSLNDSLEKEKIIIHTDTLKSTINNKDTVKKEIAEEDTITQNPPGKNTFYFRPYKYKLTGRLSVEHFYDATDPKDTAASEKETYYALNLVHSINVIVHPGDEDKPLHNFDSPTMGIKKIQVVFMGDDAELAHYLNKTITLKGELYGAFTGHHHTAVLIAATGIVR